MTEEQKERARDAIAEALGSAYDCTRCWSAWFVGTMSQNDFVPVADDAERVEEILDAVIATMSEPNLPTGDQS